MRDQDALAEFDDFRGAFSRGSREVVPPGFAWTCENNVYNTKQLQSRPGFAKDVALPFEGIGLRMGLKRMYLYTFSDGTTGFLILRVYLDGGQYFHLFDTESATPNTPILELTLDEDADFSAITLNDKIYITPHNRVTGYAGEVVYVYDGTTVRQAAGAKPSTGLAAAVSATAGNVSVGNHLIAYAFETASGFITRPSVTTLHNQTTAARKIDLSSVDTGPAGTIKRHILASKLIIGYDGNPEHYELFFVPDGIINDNIATTITIDFIDSALVSTADYTLDNLEEIPSGTALTTYQGSMVVVGEAEDSSNDDANGPYVVRVSVSGDPETFSAVDGWIKVAPGDGGGVITAIEFRSLLHFFKRHRTLATQSNGDAPSTWPVSMVDSGIGSPSPWLGEVLDAKSSNRDMILVGDEAGLYAYNGSYSEKALSWNIEEDWKNRLNIDNTEIQIDPISFRIYITAQFAENADDIPDYLIVADYKEGMSVDSVKWDYWSFAAFKSDTVYPASIQVDEDGLFMIGGNLEADDDYTYRLDNDRQTDDWESGTYNSLYETGNVPDNQDGTILQALISRLRMSGTRMNFVYSISDMEGTVIKEFPEIALTAFPNKYYEFKHNAKSESFLLTLLAGYDDSGTGADGAPFNIRKLGLYGKPLWSSRPS